MAKPNSVGPSLSSKKYGEEQCDMLLDTDVSGRILMVRFMNRKLAAKLGYAEKDLIGRNAMDFLVDAKSVAGAEHFGLLFASDIAFKAADRKLKLKDGKIVTVESCLVPMYNPEGLLIGHRGMEFFKEK